MYTSAIGNLNKPQRQLLRELHQTKRVRNRQLALHMGYKS